MSLNPLLSGTKLPGKVFQLPSKGIFYKPGVLKDTVTDAEIQVKPMSALTELKIRSADLLFSTKILEEVCIECAPEIISPRQLLSKDVDALFTFLVYSTYGSKKPLRVIHDCDGAEWHDYEVDIDHIVRNPNNSILDHRDVAFRVNMSNGFIVNLRPASFEAAVQVMNLRGDLARIQANDEPPPTELIEKIMITDLLAVIESVKTGTGDDAVTVTDVNMIVEWIRSLSKTQMDQIVRASNQSSEWGFDFKTNIVCKDCNEQFSYDLELNPINFFTG